jgi:signal transduction histidine kinase
VSRLRDTRASVSPYFTHPLVLVLWSLGVATFAIFSMLTLSNISTYRVLRQPELRIYTGFTVFGALLALCVVLSFIPMAPLYKSQVFRMMWVAGPAGYGFWVWSLVTFANRPSRLFDWFRYIFFSIAVLAFVDSLVVAATGWSAWYSLEPRPTASVTQLASGNVLRHTWFADVTSVGMIVLSLSTSFALLRMLTRAAHVERLLVFGVIVTPVLGCLEVGMVIAQSKYNLPLLFVAKLIEAVRISWVSRERLVNELHEIRAVRREQAVLLEAQLHQLELSARLVEVGERTAELSHDMRNPLTTVIGALDLVDSALRANPPDVNDAQELLAGMRTAVDHVLDLVRRITRQASEPALPPKLVSFAQVTSNAVALCQQRLGNMTVTVDVPGELWVSGWRTELTQVLVNLLVNSCDALQGHSEPWIRITARDVDGQVQVRVSDAGKRPPETVMDKMFFTRFTTGTTVASTGLGLTICAQIMRQHNGSIFVDRKASHTTIVIELPRVRARVQDAA